MTSTTAANLAQRRSMTALATSSRGHRSPPQAPQGWDAGPSQDDLRWLAERSQLESKRGDSLVQVPARASEELPIAMTYRSRSPDREKAYLERGYPQLASSQGDSREQAYERQMALAQEHVQAMQGPPSPPPPNGMGSGGVLWEERVWHDGRTYFLNRTTREKQWNRPAAECIPCRTMWIQRQDQQTARNYYYNQVSKMTQWQPPEEGFEYIWEERVQRSTGKAYYANRVTGNTQWEQPASLNQGGSGFDPMPK